MAPPTKKQVDSSALHTWHDYKNNCKRKNIYWDLDIVFFREMTSQSCIYCGKKPSNKRDHYRYSGLDRKDNTKGYIKNNVVPCCKECNSIKGNNLTHEEMLAVGKALVSFRNKNTLHKWK